MATGGVSQSIADLEIHLEVLRDAVELHVGESRIAVGAFLQPPVAGHREGVELLLSTVDESNLHIVSLVSTSQRSEGVAVDGRIEGCIGGRSGGSASRRIIAVVDGLCATPHRDRLGVVHAGHVGEVVGTICLSLILQMRSGCIDGHVGAVINRHPFTGFEHKLPHAVCTLHTCQDVGGPGGRTPIGPGSQ